MSRVLFTNQDTSSLQGWEKNLIALHKVNNPKIDSMLIIAPRMGKGQQHTLAERVKELTVGNNS